MDIDEYAARPPIKLLKLLFDAHTGKALTVIPDTGHRYAVANFALWLLTAENETRRFLSPEGIEATDAVLTLYRRQLAGEAITPAAWQRAAYEAVCGRAWPAAVLAEWEGEGVSVACAAWEAIWWEKDAAGIPYAVTAQRYTDILITLIHQQQI